MISSVHWPAASRGQEGPLLVEHQLLWLLYHHSSVSAPDSLLPTILFLNAIASRICSKNMYSYGTHRSKAHYKYSRALHYQLGKAVPVLVTWVPHLPKHLGSSQASQHLCRSVEVLG